MGKEEVLKRDIATVMDTRVRSQCKKKYKVLKYKTFDKVLTSSVPLVTCKYAHLI